MHGPDGGHAGEEASVPGGERPGVTTAPVLGGGERSLERLGAAAWGAIRSGDSAALARLRLTEEEHNGSVWPELPAADPAVNFPVDLAWQNIERRDRAALDRLLPRWRMSAFAFEAVRCEGEPVAFPSFHVLRDCRLRVRAPDGRTQEVRLFRDVLVWGGTHKIFRYDAG